jgi:chromosome segregation protein
MPYIKKVVLNNFKSFARELEIPFNNSMNVVVGPNGSGKSNIADALCFALGRLGVKSMRANKSSNLIFVGSKTIKPAHEASVKLVFDNKDGGLPFAENEVIIERIVRRNGQGIYRINNETKTRQEILELLSQAGIDPYGFNIVLQGGIQNIVRMHSDERRKILEEVAGISVYEQRKERSIHELEKTEEKLKEVSAILRERSSYLKNLEQERKQALKYKELQNSVQKFKASILSKKVAEKKKDLAKVIAGISKAQEQKEKQKTKLESFQNEINALGKEIAEINDSIYKSGGVEQETLHNEVSELKAEFTGLEVRKENNEQKLSELLKRRERMEKDLKDLESGLFKLKQRSPIVAEKYKELEQKRKALDELEKARKDLYKLKSELEVCKIRLNDKRQELQAKNIESQAILREVENLAKSLSHKELASAKNFLEKIKKEFSELSNLQEKNLEKIMKLEKEKSVLESDIQNNEKIKKQITEFDVCPLCKSKMTSEHLKEVSSECGKKIFSLSEKIKENKKGVESLNKEIIEIKNNLFSMQVNISKAESDIINLQTAEKRKERIKQLFSESKQLELEIQALENKKTSLEKKTFESKDIDEKYDFLLQEIKEISARTEANIDSEIEFKTRDLERTRIILKQSFRDEEELGSEISELSLAIENNNKILEKKEALEKELVEKFEKLIKKRNSMQEEINKKNSSILETRHESEIIDNEMNTLKIEKARIDAEIENIEFEFKDLRGIEIVSASLEVLQEKLEKTQELLNQIANVNLRALEVYDSVKNEYDEVAKKAEQLLKEKEEIMKIVEEIDKKKKRTFMKTLEEINTSFSENFQKLSAKGQAFLELENPEEPFSGGLDIVIRIAKGKYFDVTSLSGGEQTIIALSLIFAIQKYKPYPFYIFDEIDAALDKRNSERLALLIKQNLEKGQYIMITHNDALISSANVLYGVSMQDGISKLISIEL